MKLIVGLGNPGKEYINTRHNMGYDAIDLFSDVSRIDIDRVGFQGIYGKGIIFNEETILLKPTTFMNLSGRSVQEIVSFFKIAIEDIIVVYDDMAIEPGKIRLREKGSSGGHKGIQSIIELLGTEEIKRIRVGIGEPEFDPVNYVLTKPKGEDKENIDIGIHRACDAIKEALSHGFNIAMTKYN